MMTDERLFDDVFFRATGHRPYGYQVALALNPTLPEILRIPTGAGKTQAMLLAWVWRRFYADQEKRRETPRRLVWCLPMRSLVTQTAQVVAACLQNLGRDDVAVHVVLGGEIDDTWLGAPEDDAVLIGTQDMLLSRALCRGYGASRFRWPALFGVLNNDALWVYDEVQLMGAGLSTSAQLDAFRRVFGTLGNTPSMWVSATAEPQWLETVNREAPKADKILSLAKGEAEGRLAQVLWAPKTLRKLSCAALPAGKADVAPYAKEVARFASERHKPATRTIVIANTVLRAVEIYNQLMELRPAAKVVLLHSRFRPVERNRITQTATAEVESDSPGIIVVSTQVLEAGIDITSSLMVTEVAPWSSLVQRVGRVNRKGESSSAEVWWTDLPDWACPPYRTEEIARSRDTLEQLEGTSISPAALPNIPMAFSPEHIIRRRDFEGLFDTTPDVMGMDLDISRFIRSDDVPDARLLWRLWSGDAPPATMERPHRDELCPVPVSDLRNLLKRNVEIWRWDYVERRWTRAVDQDIYPGQTFLVHSKAGRYLEDQGWQPNAKGTVRDTRVLHEPSPDSIESSPDDYVGSWTTLSEHSADVVSELRVVLSKLGSSIPVCQRASLIAAAWLHDVGKAHPVFKEAMLEGLESETEPARRREVWAKRPYRKNSYSRYRRRGFRHELASALAILSLGEDFLVAYLAAAHHGKVRCKIRALPGKRLAPAGVRHAFGVQDGDVIEPLDIGDYQIPRQILSLERTELGLTSTGQQSWTDMVAELLVREGLGPIRLAYLESLLIAADWRASIREQGGDLADDFSESSDAE